MRCQVAIIGGGPSGMLLGQLLHRAGIDAVVLERKTRDYVLGRIRAGILETGFVHLMRQAGVATRLEAESFRHDGILIADGEDVFRIDFKAMAGKSVVLYGQTEVTRDLYDAREAVGARTCFDVEGVEIEGADGEAPAVHFTQHGQRHRLACDFIAGCDGFHGVSRRSIPTAARREYEKVYPFGWLGILSETPPVHDELIYSKSTRGFALASMRNDRLSRYYLQVPLSDRPEDWSDEAFWGELRTRLPAPYRGRLITGPSIEKSIAPLRSFVTEPMRWGRLFLCGDAAHIVPPTGAKGLNTAASDIHYLFNALSRFYNTGDREGIERYSETALARIWLAERFSWWMTNLLHSFPDEGGFEHHMQAAEMALLRGNENAQRLMAQNYVGLPY